MFGGRTDPTMENICWNGNGRRQGTSYSSACACFSSTHRTIERGVPSIDHALDFSVCPAMHCARWSISTRYPLNSTHSSDRWATGSTLGNRTQQVLNRIIASE
ncbi:hypothetical protein K440DRAFT_409868 [Wilcoxina mikolae CBS 423.85]|nr:hypothetical protein K440DRAFT_409868 [Wilcoxina mikolae CBS 423.85]